MPETKRSSSCLKNSFSDVFKNDEDTDYYDYVLNTSSLPVDHKRARGRGRSLQLSKMSEEQREEEKLLTLEKNRLAAKDSRIKKKRKLNEMQGRINYLENIISTKKESKDFVEELNKKEERIEILEQVLYNQSETIQRLLEENSTD